MTKSSGVTERQPVYVGLDVSKNETQLCVVNADGGKLFEAKVATEPDALIRAIARTAEKHEARVELIGLEMGAMAGWLWRELKAWGLPAVCIDARHAHAALSTRMNSEADQRRVRGTVRPPNDRGDARGIAELMRTGWFREVAPRSEESQALRALMVARSRLVRMRGDAQNQIRGLLKERGIRLPRAVGAMFRRRVREAMEERLAEGDHLHLLIDTFLRLHEQLCAEQNGIERRIRYEAATDETTRRLMTIPGVGVMTATCFRQTIDDPHRFTSSATVGAYLGLTPRRHQSGEMDWTGRILKPWQLDHAGTPLRGGDRDHAPPPADVRDEEVGRSVGRAHWPAAGQGRAGAQARRDDACDLGRRNGVRLEPRRRSSHRGSVMRLASVRIGEDRQR